MLAVVPDVCLVAVIFATQSSSSRIHFSISFRVLLIPSSVFFYFNYYILHLCSAVLYIFSLLKKF